jgi:hypothetical protein
MEIRYQRCVSEQNIRVNLTRALGTLLAGLQDRKEKLHRDKKEATKKVELPRNLQQLRQPADAGRARRLRAR